jgi:hypothetical protein
MWVLSRLETRWAAGLVQGRIASEEPTEKQFSLEDTFDKIQAKRLQGIAESVTSALTRTDPLA